MAKDRTLPDKYEAGFLAKMDGRTDLAKRLNYTYSEIIDDCGGVVALPHAKLCLVERFAFLEEFLRQMERKLADDPVGQADLLGKWVQAVNSMSGLAKQLGFNEKRQQKDWIDVALYEDDPPDSPENTPDAPSTGGKRKRR